MGCLHSKSKAAKADATAAPPSPTAQAAGSHLASSSPPPTTASGNLPGTPPRPDTAVLRRASAFDQMDETARKTPELTPVQTVPVGAKSAKLLAGFEAKEAAARAPPVLQSVEKTDLRKSKLFDKLQEYEANDARAAAEPKLEKTFAQRQAEAVAA